MAFPYIAGEEADCYANDEDCPEDVEALQSHQQSIEEVVAKEGLVDGHWVYPCTVNNPEKQQHLPVMRSNMK